MARKVSNKRHTGDNNRGEKELEAEAARLLAISVNERVAQKNAHKAARKAASEKVREEKIIMCDEIDSNKYISLTRNILRNKIKESAKAGKFAGAYKIKESELLRVGVFPTIKFRPYFVFRITPDLHRISSKAKALIETRYRNLLESEGFVVNHISAASNCITFELSWDDSSIDFNKGDFNK